MQTLQGVSFIKRVVRWFTKLFAILSAVFLFILWHVADLWIGSQNYSFDNGVSVVWVEFWGFMSAKYSQMLHPRYWQHWRASFRSRDCLLNKIKRKIVQGEKNLVLTWFMVHWQCCCSNECSFNSVKGHLDPGIAHYEHKRINLYEKNPFMDDISSSWKWSTLIFCVFRVTQYATVTSILFVETF